MAYFKHVKSNVKGGVDAELGEKTIILGPNGSGKSAVQNSLELATRGFVTDLTGRDEVRKASDLFALGSAGELYAHATLDDGTEFKWSTHKSGKSVKKPETTQPVPVAWPVLDIEAVLKGNAETQRKWLLQVAGTVTRSAIHAYLTETDHYDSIAFRYSCSESEMLTKVLEVAASEARKTKTQITASEKTIESMSRGLGAEPSASDLAQMEAAVRDAENAIKPQPPQGITLAQVQYAQQEAHNAAVKCSDLSAKYQAALRKRESIQVPPTANLIRSLSETVRLAAELDMSACVVCGNEEMVPDWSALAADYDRWLERFKEASQLDTFVEVLKRNWQNAKAQAEERINRWQSLQGQYNAQGPTETVDNTAALAALREAQEKHSTARAAFDSWRRVRDERELLKEKKAYYREMTNLKDDCRKAIEDLAKQAVTTIEEAVQAHLPESDDFRLVLDGKTISMGFVRDGMLHTALSGAEWARLTIAVAAAKLRLTGHEGPAVLTPKERAWDPATLSSVMRALTDAPGQVLLLSPIKPKGRLPKGWTMVEVG